MYHRKKKKIQSVKCSGMLSLQLRDVCIQICKCSTSKSNHLIKYKNKKKLQSENQVFSSISMETG
jgi:hypothetical protein